MVAYHDDEWGVPTHDDARALRAAHARRRAGRAELAHHPQQARGLPRRVRRLRRRRRRPLHRRATSTLVQDASIVRHRGKIESTSTTRSAIQAVQDEHGSFDAYVWSFVDGTPIVGTWQQLDELPSSPTRRPRSARTSSGAASDSSGRPRCTRSCRRPASSTTTSSAASGTEPRDHDRRRRRRAPRPSSWPARHRAVVVTGDRARRGGRRAWARRSSCAPTPPTCRRAPSPSTGGSPSSPRSEHDAERRLRTVRSRGRATIDRTRRAPRRVPGAGGGQQPRGRRRQPGRRRRTTTRRPASPPRSRARATPPSPT